MSRSVAFPSGDPAFCPKGHLRLISCCVALRHPDFRVSIAERDGVGLLFMTQKFGGKSRGREAGVARR